MYRAPLSLLFVLSMLFTVAQNDTLTLLANSWQRCGSHISPSQVDNICFFSVSPLCRKNQISFWTLNDDASINYIQMDGGDETIIPTTDVWKLEEGHLYVGGYVYRITELNETTLRLHRSYAKD